MVEKSGTRSTETVNYAYNTLGQLTELTDGSGNLIVTYTYNSLGELTARTTGTAPTPPTPTTPTATSWTWSTTPPAARSTAASSTRTTRSARRPAWRRSTAPGPTATTTTASSSTRPSPRPIPAIPSQDLTYEYNAAGDRTQTIVNGVTTHLHEQQRQRVHDGHSADGTTTYTYNANGDLVSKTDAVGHDDVHLRLAQSAGERDLADR